MTTAPGRDVGAPVLVVVTGPSRSGTSTAAGALHQLGMHVPGPLKEPDDANPRGYFETTWVNDFHKSVLGPIPVRTGDSRPGAAREAAEAGARPEVVDQLHTWLAEQLRLAPRGRALLIKDPRAIWLPELWSSVTGELGVDLRYLVMLRHPAEVARSRDGAFLQDRDESFRRQRETSNVAAWCNLMVVAERATRGRPRCFLRYDDLVSDWRTAMQAVADRLEVDLGPLGLEPHVLDDFVDRSLYRSAPDWEGLDVPAGLPDLAERTWGAVQRLADDPQDEDALRQLGGLASEYHTLQHHAVALALDSITAQDVQARQRVRRRLEKRHRNETRALRDELARARGRVNDQAR